MTELIKRRDLIKLTKGLKSFPGIAERNIFSAQERNAQEAKSYMQTLVPHDDGVTRSETTAAAYKNASGTIGFAMRTQRLNQDPRNPDKLERIKAILFANNQDFFYGVWNLNKKRWRGRMRRAMTKSARELTGKL